MKITLIGTGYVGLVSGACFADVGNTVTCLDIDQDKIDRLNCGEIPIHEPGLDTLVARNLAAGRLFFTTDPAHAVAHADVIFIAVGTPPDEDGSADMRHMLAAARTVGRHMTHSVVVVDKSTVPVGTADAVRKVIAAELAGRHLALEFHVVSNPEFLKEGAAIDDFMRPDRIIVGSDNAAATQLMRQLYAPFSRNHDKLMEMDIRSAELTKYAANAMLATRISFMNELANLAELVGADIEAIRLGIGSDKRIGSDFLYAGMGYGGSCFPKDVKALLKTSADHGRPLQILEAIERVNTAQKNILFEKIVSHFGGKEKLKGKTVAVWGLSFKPNTDDMRDAPALVLIRQLMAAHCTVQAYDPVACTTARSALIQENGADVCGRFLAMAPSAKSALEGADALALVTEWKEFQSPDFQALAATLKARVIFDGRNLYDPGVVAAAGLEYHAIGRGALRVAA